MMMCLWFVHMRGPCADCEPLLCIGSVPHNRISGFFYVGGGALQHWAYTQIGLVCLNTNVHVYTNTVEPL